MNRRDNLRALATAMACATLPGLSQATAARRHRTYVLIHGAFHGGWCWREVAAELRRRGHLVFTPTLTGTGERAHLLSKDVTLDLWVQDIANVLRFERLNDVVLVGHSFGGLTVCGVADRLKAQLQHLVFLDALLLEPGQSAFDARPAADAARATQLAQSTSNGLSVPPPPLAAFGLKDERLVADVTPLLTPHPLSAYTSKLNLQGPLGNGVPSTYIVCNDPVFAPLEPSRSLARRMGCTFRDIPTNHEAMLTMPRELATMLDEI